MSNIQVHFASSEGPSFGRLAIKVGVRNCLASAFRFISHEHGIKTSSFEPKENPFDPLPFLCENAGSCILDSGFFSVLFGTSSNIRDSRFPERWQQSLTRLILQSGWTGYVIEVDAQKLVGPEATWTLRRRLADEVPNQVINVVHLEDGQKGLDRLIEYSDYLAVSVPELRFAKKPEAAYRLASYIKNRKPSIDIHLLGCTQPSMLRQLRFCTSSDSTSWTSVGRYGNLDFYDGHRRRMAVIGRNLPTQAERFMPLVSSIISELKRKDTPAYRRYMCNYALAISLKLKEYTIAAGPQH